MRKEMNKKTGKKIFIVLMGAVDIIFLFWLIYVLGAQRVPRLNPYKKAELDPSASSEEANSEQNLPVIRSKGQSFTVNREKAQAPTDSSSEHQAEPSSGRPTEPSSEHPTGSSAEPGESKEEEISSESTSSQEESSSEASASESSSSSQEESSSNASASESSSSSSQEESSSQTDASDQDQAR